MVISKKSLFTGITHQFDIPVTIEQINDWQNGMHIQDVMPHLEAWQREFLISGATPEEWDELFKEQ